MIVFTFSVLDKDSRERFFEGSLLLANVKSDVVFKIPFLIISNANVDFQAWDLQWRSYTTGNVFPTTRQVKLKRKKEFATTVFNPKHKAFIVHIATFSINSGDKVYLSKKTQIAHHKVDKALTKVSNKYADFVDIFSAKLAVELPQHTEINNYVIKLVDN